MEKDDILYHTTFEKNMINLNSYNRGKTITHTRYPEPRVYFGLNQITTKPGHLTDSDWRGLLKKVSKFSHQVFGGRSDARSLRVYQATDIKEGEIVYGDPEMLVNLESSEAIFHEINGRSIQSVYVPNRTEIKVEDITDIISTIDEIYKKE